MYNNSCGDMYSIIFYLNKTPLRRILRDNLGMKFDMSFSYRKSPKEFEENSCWPTGITSCLWPWLRLSPEQSFDVNYDDNMMFVLLFRDCSSLDSLLVIAEKRVQIWRTMYASSTSVKFWHCKGDIEDDTSK